MKQDYHSVDALKGSAEILDYSIDWSKEMATYEVITSISATTADTATINSTGHVNQMVTVWISGGTPGESSDIVITANTDQSRRFVGHLVLHIL